MDRRHQEAAEKAQREDDLAVRKKLRLDNREKKLREELAKVTAAKGKAAGPSGANGASGAAACSVTTPFLQGSPISIIVHPYQHFL